MRRFELAKSTGAIHVPSLIPESHMPFRNFLSIPPRMIHERIAKVSTENWPYLLTISKNITSGQASLNVSNPTDPVRKQFWGCPEVRDLLYPVSDLIPPPQEGDPDTVVLWSTESYPRRVVAWEVAEQARKYTDEGVCE